VQVLVRSLVAGVDPVAMPLFTGFDVNAFATAASEMQTKPGRHYTALVPTQLHRLLDAGGVGVQAAQGFDAIVLGGAATSPQLRKRAADAGIRVVGAYGMSETASGCIYDGAPLDGVEIRLADEDNGIGVVEVSGKLLANGYRLQPALSDEAFADGWFRTGDLGRQDGGTIEVLGRADDMINTGGVKIAPVLVERALLAQPSVSAACAVGVPDERWGDAVVAAIVPTDPRRGFDEAALADAVRREVGRAGVPKRFVSLPAFPMRGPGKVDRAAVRDTIID
jgi:O-succinylbenzoic acid--CoA ligase